MNQTVFGTEMVLLTLIALTVQLMTLFIHFGVIITKPYHRPNWRFLLLIALFIIYNICSGLFPDVNISWMSVFTQNILAFGSGIALASYYFFFLVKEIEITQRKFFNVKFLVTSLILAFLLLYIITYLLYGDFQISKSLFIIPPVIVALYFGFNTVMGIRLLSSNDSVRNSYRNLNLAGKLGIVFMASMPVVAAVGDYQVINNGLVNVSFLLITVAFYILIFLQAKNKKDMNYKYMRKDIVLGITEFGLTPRELEIAGFILKGESYKDLADKMNIARKTISKHASNIFKKTECCNREEFIRKFLSG